MSKTSPSFPTLLRSRARRLLWLCALASLSAPLSRLIRLDALWALELFGHWQWLYLGLGMLCLALLLVLRDGWRCLVPSAVLALVFAHQPTSLPATQEGDAKEPSLLVASANLNLASRDFQPLQHWLLGEQAPDLLFLQEFTAVAQQALASDALRLAYPYRVEAPQADPFGLAILSRHPLSDIRIVEPADAQQTLRLHASMHLAERRVALAALHPMPPLSSAFARARDRTLAEESERLAQGDKAALMAGDFNATPWSRTLFGIDPRLQRASGLAPTWPNAFSGLSLLPLDHVFASGHWRRIDAGLGPDLGSDHRPVVVHLQLR
ncbi:endonuclease/exonuclease/phosphatase family protein [Pseudomonas mangrovi]|uniref:endonuclease/exonuclease/phosphatase family protein n=1 Tax=Pseudomonas mangrovi TaxID=2161748 RepID=UPI0018EF9223|nr:endonuclease/exonuclease/phosphatase family protein [Pseudomonas mangrovi]